MKSQWFCWAKCTVAVYEAIYLKQGISNSGGSLQANRGNVSDLLDLKMAIDPVHLLQVPGTQPAGQA